MDWLFSVFPVMFVVVFLTFFIIFVSTLLTGLARRKKDNESPRLTVPAVVVSRRTEYHSNAAQQSTMGRTSYYATFQVESGDRMEFSMTGPEYGVLAEGDRGRLSFQGTRYLGFARD